MIRDKTGNIDRIDWTVYGKIARITKAPEAGSEVIAYTYDASGNRISKLSKQGSRNTFYVRDAQGNVMSVYEGNEERMMQTETDLYGSSRLGLVSGQIATENLPETNEQGYGPAQVSVFTRGEKQYELSNHLGNVLTTISDRRQQQTTDNIRVRSYRAEVVSATDYYPFGMQMPERTFNASTYRYGFNGQEKDNDVAGDGNIMTATYWEYDSRIGRRWNTDPKPNLSISPYSTFNNSPIFNSDPFGDTTVNGAGGKVGINIDEKANSLEFYERADYYLKGKTMKVPVEAGQLRSFTNSLGTFTARWATDENGNVSFAGYKNAYGKTIEDVVEFANSATFKIFSYFYDQAQDLDKHPLEHVGKLLLLQSVPEMMELPPAETNPTFVTQESMSALGTLNFPKLPLSPSIYIPETPLLQQTVAGWDIPLPDPHAAGYPHTTLGGRLGSDGVLYRQSATFTEGTWPLANGERVPWSRVDWTNHSRPWDHPNPHQHIFFWNKTRWEFGNQVPFP